MALPAYRHKTFSKVKIVARVGSALEEHLDMHFRYEYWDNMERSRAANEPITPKAARFQWHGINCRLGVTRKVIQRSE